MKTILSAFILLSLCFISCTFSSSTNTGSKTSNTTRTINGAEIRYNETIAEDQANTLIDYLKKNNFFDGTPVKVQVNKVAGVVHFAMVINDKDAASEEYQALGTVMIDELQQQVFKGSMVEIDYCDDNFNIIKNIKGTAGVSDVTAVSMPDATKADESKLFNKSWFCENITGGAPRDEAKAAKDLEILKNNFSFNFDEGGTFGSQFINQHDVTSPVEVLGSYTLNGNSLSLHHLTIGGQPTNQQMNFSIRLIDDKMQLISQEPGQPNLVMTFTPEYE